MTQTQRTALVTGSAGFIGFHTAQRLLQEGWAVIGLDAMTDYYDVALKERRHQILKQHNRFQAVEDRLEASGTLMRLFEEHKPDAVIHLAAQAGVRYSIDAPRSYVEANLVGTFELLEAARAFPGQVAVGLDARGGKVATRGWAEETDMEVTDLARAFEDAGIAAIIYTDIDRDGAMGGRTWRRRRRWRAP